MDTKIKALILLLFSAFTTFAQTPGINFAAKFNITSATGGDPYNITGIVLDDLSRFTGSDVQVNDSIYVIDGDQLYVLAVTSITSVVGPTVTLVANDPNNAGVSIPTGQAAICRPTDNYKLPLYISGLRDDLRSMVMNRQAQLIDDINGSAVSAITDFTSAGVNVPPSPAASLNGGETWRNMTTGELWGSDGNVWYPYTRGPKECQDTVLVSAITVQSGGSVTTGSPLIRNSSGVWEHMYNHPSGLNLIPDGVVTDIIVGGKAIVQYCGVRKGSGATPNTSYYVNQSISTGFTTTLPSTDIRPLGKVASNGDFLINAGLLFSRDNNLNVRDSTFAKDDNTYGNKRITGRVYRTSTIALGANDFKIPYRSGNVESEVDLKIKHSRHSGSSSAPSVYIENNSGASSGAYIPLMWGLDSASAPTSLPFMLYQAYFPAASAAGNNTTGGIGWNLTQNGGSYDPTKAGGLIQFEQNFSANTPGGDVELWSGFNLPGGGTYRPWYFTASKADGTNSYGSIAADIQYFTRGGANATQNKGIWSNQSLQIGNPITNQNFALDIKALGTGRTVLSMYRPDISYQAEVLKFDNTTPGRLTFSPATDVQLGSKIFSFDCQNVGKAIIAASWNAFTANDTINFGWWSGVPGAGVFDNAPIVRFIGADNGGVLIGRHGRTTANFAQLGQWADHFYISTTGPAPASTTTPGFSMNNTNGNVGIFVDPSTLTGTNRLTVGGTILSTSLTGTGTRLVTASPAGVLGTSGIIGSLMREESFTATAAQTVFTIAYSAPAVSGTSVPIRVYRNGVRLFYVASGPTITQFTYSGTTVTTAANTVGDIITIEYLN